MVGFWRSLVVHDVIRGHALEIWIYPAVILAALFSSW